MNHPRGSTNTTQFSLAFGSEVVVPVEVGIPIAQLEEFDEQANKEPLLLNLDFLEERRGASQLVAPVPRRVRLVQVHSTTSNIG